MVGENNTVIVPLSVANENGVIAVDIPLKFSEGVTLSRLPLRTAGRKLGSKIQDDNEKPTVVVV
jgi:hypothetical protein